MTEGLSLNNRAAVAGAADRELISELKSRGYKVCKADKVRVVSAQKCFDVGMLLMAHERHGFMDHVYKSLGAHLGGLLMESGCVPVIKEIDGDRRHVYRTSATVIVEDPQFDWPYHLREVPG